MRTIRLIRDAEDLGDRGPGVGMRALQKALRAADIPWLKVAGQLQTGEIPWFWCWKDAGLAQTFEEVGWPWLCGPNILFHDSKRPGFAAYERRILSAQHCLMIFTESQWYARLIHEHRAGNMAPIVIWNYPIDPFPEGPLEPIFDLLIYFKSKSLGRVCLDLQSQWPRHKLFIYGHYKREDLVESARRARAAVFLSDNDRGPLAAAEIALTGCPLVGIEKGCPWVKDVEGVGIEIKDFAHDFTATIECAMDADREEVRMIAEIAFAPERAVATIRAALEPIACAG